MKVVLRAYVFISLFSLAQCAEKNVWIGRYDSPKKIKKSLSSLEKVKQFTEKNVSYYHFRKGDKVADIGAYDGMWDALFSPYTDSVIFYLQDTDSSAFRNFSPLLKSVEKLYHKTTTDKFITVLGSEKKLTFHNLFLIKY